MGRHIGQTPTAKYVTVHPTGIIEVEGETTAGRRVGLYIVGDQLDFLRRTFAFAEAKGFGPDHLGHASWHIKEGVAEWQPCSTCDSIMRDQEAKGVKA